MNFVGATLTPVAATLIVSVFSTRDAAAQDAAAKYERVYSLSGFLLRSAIVCPGNQRATVDRALSLVASDELRALAKAYPQTTEGWSLKGAQFFNSAVMQFGLPAMCKKVR